MSRVQICSLGGKYHQFADGRHSTLRPHGTPVAGQTRLRHPMRPQDPDGVHGPCRRADDIIQVFLNRQFVSERNAEYFQRMNALDGGRQAAVQHDVASGCLGNDLDRLRCIQRQIIDLCPGINVGNFKY